VRRVPDAVVASYAQVSNCHGAGVVLLCPHKATTMAVGEEGAGTTAHSSFDTFVAIGRSESRVHSLGPTRSWSDGDRSALRAAYGRNLTSLGSRRRVGFVAEVVDSIEKVNCEPEDCRRARKRSWWSVGSAPDPATALWKANITRPHPMRKRSSAG